MPPAEIGEYLFGWPSPAVRDIVFALSELRTHRLVRRCRAIADALPRLLALLAFCTSSSRFLTVNVIDSG